MSSTKVIAFLIVLLEVWKGYQYSKLAFTCSKLTIETLGQDDGDDGNKNV